MKKQQKVAKTLIKFYLKKNECKKKIFKELSISETPSDSQTNKRLLTIDESTHSIVNKKVNYNCILHFLLNKKLKIFKFNFLQNY